MSVLVGGLLVSPAERSRVVSLLAVGAGTHLVADGLLLSPTGRSFAVFWPLSRIHPPTPGLYMSTNPGPTAVAVGVAILVFSARNGTHLR